MILLNFLLFFFQSISIVQGEHSLCASYEKRLLATALVYLEEKCLSLMSNTTTDLYSGPTEVVEVMMWTMLEKGGFEIEKMDKYNYIVHPETLSFYGFAFVVKGVGKEIRVKMQSIRFSIETNDLVRSNRIVLVPISDGRDSDDFKFSVENLKTGERKEYETIIHVRKVYFKTTRMPDVYEPTDYGMTAREPVYETTTESGPAINYGTTTDEPTYETTIPGPYIDMGADEPTTTTDQYSSTTITLSNDAEIEAAITPFLDSSNDYHTGHPVILHILHWVKLKNGTMKFENLELDPKGITVRVSNDGLENGLAFVVKGEGNVFSVTTKSLKTGAETTRDSKLLQNRLVLVPFGMDGQNEKNEDLKFSVKNKETGEENRYEPVIHVVAGMKSYMNL